MDQDSGFTVKEFSELNSERRQEAFTECDDWEPKDYALAAIGPVGYIGHLLMKRARGEEVNDGEIFEEIADGLIYLDQLCTALGGDLDIVLARKFNETSKKAKCDHKLPIREG